MKLIPKIGAEDIPFGTSADELLHKLGSPVSEHILNDVDGYPKSRHEMDYGARGFLVTPEFGVIAIDVDAEQVRIELWGTFINDMSPTDLATFLHERGCESKVTAPNG